MLERIHQKLGTASFIISIIALVAAMGGAAYAATKLNSTQKKEVEKIAKKYAGKPGSPGTAGAPGAKGDTGTAGANGANGTSGTNGVSVTTAAASGGECPSGGGIKVMSASPTTKVCNGTTGFTETLPSEATETGSWGFSDIDEHALGVSQAFVPVSFNIPLAAPLAAAKVHQTGDSGFAAACPGSAETPEAEPGNFCLYTAFHEEATVGAIEKSGGAAGQIGASTAGVVLRIDFEESVVALRGTWAVTAE